MQPAVQFNQVSKKFGTLTALDSISFSIPKGSFFALLGVNGAGKSTLINAMAGLVVPTNGSIQVLGKDTITDYKFTRRKLGLVPQEIISDPFFTIYQLLTFQLGYFGIASNKKWLDELLERLHLADKKHASVQALSGGMKRRLLIAMALVHKPEVIVLDEPTAGVDVELRKILWSFAQELYREGKTIILTTHYLEEAEALCEQVAILNQGKLLACSSMEALIDRHPYHHLKITLEPTSKLGEIMSKLPKIWADRRVKKTQQNQQTPVATNKYYFEVPQQEKINDLLGWISHNNIEITNFSLRRPPLEEVFVQLVNLKV